MKNVKINGKWDILLPNHRAARPEWYTTEGWERARLDSMNQYLTKDDTLFYVGAEEGDMAALCQMWGARLLLFEPNPKVWPNIKAIWEANHLDIPFCWVGFASNKSTNDAQIIKGFPDAASGEMIPDHGFMELENHNAPEVKIDDIPIVPTAISIDVEGSEWEVLKGAEQALLKFHPKIWLSIHPEFMYEKYKVYSADLRQWVKERGYDETILDYQHELHVLYFPTEDTK